MLSITELFSQRTHEVAGKRISERGELIQYFTDKINSERLNTKFKPVKVSFVAYRVSHLNVSDLYYLKSIADDCERRTGNFGKCFFGSLKPRACKDCRG